MQDDEQLRDRLHLKSCQLDYRNLTDDHMHNQKQGTQDQIKHDSPSCQSSINLYILEIKNKPTMK